eukprot:scaffold16.g13.t1
MPVRGVLVDLSGTLHVEDQAIAGAQAALARLRQHVQVRFCSNTTAKSRRALLALLQRMEFDVLEEEVFTSLSAARRLIDERQLRPLLLLHPDAMADFEGVPEGDPNSVVVGLAKEAFTYAMPSRKHRVVHGLTFPCSGRYFKEPDGLSLGPGPFVTALEEAAGRQATVVGKPERAFFELALADMSVAPEEAVMIGDDVESDGVLVRTGKYVAGNESRRGVVPDAVVPDFPVAVNWVLAKLEE